ncbi:MAG TPA: ABC transporter substrate-binding protein [Chitinispirillaceae bacterium]|nr:ABC transporter substrate-binding protein [Chitinispirillaceae bacterium]
MIRASQNLKQIVSTYPFITSLFRNAGLGAYCEPGFIDKAGKYMQLGSILRQMRIDVDQFVKAINMAIDEQNDKCGRDKELFNVKLLCLLPCGLRNIFREHLTSFFSDHYSQYSSFRFLCEGNVNHELNFYDQIDSIDDLNQLPELLITSDFNNVMHQRFLRRFADSGEFVSQESTVCNSWWNEVGFSDTLRHFTMLTANMLVIVVDRRRLGNRVMPAGWEDLLSDNFRRDIIMRGDGDFFCNAVLLPLYQRFGANAMIALGCNVKCGMHPAQMVKQLNGNSDAGATVYVMPWFFTLTITSDWAAIVWPREGAIASPVSMLVKKDAAERYHDLIDYIMSASTAELLVNHKFPTLHHGVANRDFGSRILWTGWDFIRDNDLAEVKLTIQNLFMPSYTSGAGGIT